MDVFEGVRVVEMAHTNQILGEIGCAPGDIAALRRSGTVG